MNSSRDDAETVIHSDNDFATVAYLRVNNASLQLKTQIGHFTLTTPHLLSEPYASIRDDIADCAITLSTPGQKSPGIPIPEPTLPPSIRQIGTWVAVANVQGDFATDSHNLSIEDEVRQCFETLKGIISFGNSMPTLLINPSSASLNPLPDTGPLRQHQHLPLLYGPIRAR